MAEAKFFAPADMGEAFQLLGEYGGQLTVLAGGTDLVPKFNYYEVKPEAIMYIGNLGLDYIKSENGALTIGASARTAQVAESRAVQEKAPALARAARLSGAPATRTSATIGGNIANASPAADLVAPLLAMDAQVTLAGPNGSRVVPLDQFFLGVNETVCQPDELLTQVTVPAAAGKTVFLKLGRRKALTFSVVNTAVRLDIQDGVCRAARVVLGSMAPTPKRCKQAEVLLEGKRVDVALIRQAAAAAVAETKPIDDQRASAWYRQKAGAGLVAQALAQAADVELE